MQPHDLEAAITSTVRGADGRAARRVNGQVFTPPALARIVCRAVLGPLGERGRTLRVLDPACGDGRFLAAAAELAPGARLVGIERDAEVAAACRARVPSAAVHVADALFELPAGAGDADAVIGNPPYLRSIRLKDADPAMWRRVRGAFAATTHGEWDLYGAFVEASLGWVRPGGRIGWIVPSRWMTAAWAARLRGLLAGRGAVREIVDFGAAQVFPDATTYASIVIMERGGERPAPVSLLRREPDGRWGTASMDVAALGERPWVPHGPPAAGGDAPLTLGDVAHIAKGTGTNADGVYVLDDAVLDGAWVDGVDGDGQRVTVEAAATRPCWRGRDVQPGATPRARCILPYDDAGVLIRWPRLRAQWPRAAAHLAAHRARLEARERGRFAGDAFHVFGRPQNIAFHLDRTPKIIVPDVARTPRAVLDDGGALVLDTAYALRPRPGAAAPWDDVAALHALCTSPALLDWLARAGVPLRGDYRRFKTRFLAPMPLPPALPSRA